MKTLRLLAIVGAVAVACALMAQGRGQGRGFMRGGGSPVQLLNRTDVQTDLKLSDDQKTKITALNDQMRQDMQNAFQNAQASGDQGSTRTAMQQIGDKYRPQFEAILSADQNKRLLGIYVQMNGNRSVSDPGVAKAIGLSDDQKAKIKDLQDKQNQANQDLFQKMRDGELDRQGLQDAMKKNNDTLDTAIGGILTDSQKSQLKALEGPKFTATDTGRGGGGFGGGRGGRRGGGGAGGNGGGGAGGGTGGGM